MTTHPSSQRAEKEEQEEDAPVEGRSLFAMLRARFDRNQRMLLAVLGNDTKTVAKLLRQGFKVASTVQQEGGKSPLHIAAQRGCLPMVELLLKAGADPLQKNAFNMSAVDLAALHRHTACLELLVSASPGLLDVEHLWQQSDGARFLWRSATDDVLALLIRASPNLNAARSNVRSNVWFLCISEQMLLSLQAWVLTGTAVSSQEVAALSPQRHQEFLAWYKTFCRTVQPLQHHCRLAIRRSLHGRCNVLRGAQLLPLPKSLQDYITLQKKTV